MGKRGKYGAQKRQRELKKKKKREAKLERKRSKRESPEGVLDTTGDEVSE